MTGALPERRMRLLDGRRLDDDVVELPVLALRGEPLVRRPRLGDDVDRFLEPRFGLLHRDAEADELVVAVALADAEIQPSAGQQVHRRRLLRQQHGVVPRQHDHRRAEAKRARAGADPGQQVERGGDLAEAGEMMLDDERALIAQRLGLDDVLDVVLKAGGAVHVRAAALRLGRAEQSELHRCSPPPDSRSGIAWTWRQVCVTSHGITRAAAQRPLLSLRGARRRRQCPGWVRTRLGIASLRSQCWVDGPLTASLCQTGQW